jgi:hypothetical protein
VEPIEVLLGADVTRRLLTGCQEVLSGGLVAVETYLGRTLMGKTSQNETVNAGMAVIVTSLLLKRTEISDSWRLDLIGISDPMEKKSKEQVHQDTLRHFKQTVKVN